MTEPQLVSPPPDEPIRIAVTAARHLPGPGPVALAGAAIALAIGGVAVRRMLALAVRVDCANSATRIDEASVAGPAVVVSSCMLRRR